METEIKKIEDSAAAVAADFEVVPPTELKPVDPAAVGAEVEVCKASHTTGHTCAHPSHAKTNRQISDREVRRLNANGYNQVSTKFNTAFVLLNKKTGKLVELWAASDVHACRLIGWNPKHAVVLRRREREKDENQG